LYSIDNDVPPCDYAAELRRNGEILGFEGKSLELFVKNEDHRQRMIRDFDPDLTDLVRSRMDLEVENRRHLPRPYSDFVGADASNRDRLLLRLLWDVILGDLREEAGW
jgi:hypothetical protein